MTDPNPNQNSNPPTTAPTAPTGANAGGRSRDPRGVAVPVDAGHDPSSQPQFDPRHDYADAPARPGDDATPLGVQDASGSRPIDRIERAGRGAPGPAREPARRGLTVAIVAFFVVAGITIAAVVMQRPVPTLGFAAIAVGMLLLFAFPSLLATTVDPEPKPRGERDGTTSRRSTSTSSADAG
jgi:hypothetical protein